MDFQYSDEHKMVEKLAYDFTRKEVMPIIKEHDRNHTYPHELLPKMAALGFLGVCLPVRYGGGGVAVLVGAGPGPPGPGTRRGASSSWSAAIWRCCSGRTSCAGCRTRPARR